MICIVIAYHNRKRQLENTLKTISSKCDYKIVIVDDASDEPLQGAINISKDEKYWLNDGTIPYNKGIEKALEMGAEKIILQNAECYHVGNIIAYVNENLTDENYLSFACYSLGKDEGLEKNLKENDRPVLFNGDNGWYNHSIHRPCHYFFCGAITANNIKKLNGFDERFSHGVAMADADFIRRVTLLGLKKEIVDFPYCVHQWHYEGFDPYSRQDLYKKNIKLGASLKGLVAVHEKTKDF